MRISCLHLQIEVEDVLQAVDEMIKAHGKNAKN